MLPVYFITFLASTATAASCRGKRIPPYDQVTVARAQQACGNDMSVHCCNEVSDKSTGNALGNGLGLLNGLSLFDGCSGLDLNVIGVADGLLNKKCSARAACCQNSDSTATGGLINVALPCIALSSLI
ncbi:hypothetical protein NW762_014581 [Fusarium torreyae]|uniref:Hydrophobin n=1 Tax=Fusarium torreyae TaxID=1237075 RepID=A0A9W8RJS3_9HYPO|nr:hypothetical protein NW762_014581 [Fusarium torreyae]